MSDRHATIEKFIQELRAPTTVLHPRCEDLLGTAQDILLQSDDALPPCEQLLDAIEATCLRRQQERERWEDPRQTVFGIIRGHAPIPRKFKEFDAVLYALHSMFRIMFARKAHSEKLELSRFANRAVHAYGEVELLMNHRTLLAKRDLQLRMDSQTTSGLFTNKDCGQILLSNSYWSVFSESLEVQSFEAYEFLMRAASFDARVFTLRALDAEVSRAPATRDASALRSWVSRYASLPMPDKATEWIREFMLSWEVEPTEIERLDEEDAPPNADSMRIIRCSRPDDTTKCFDRCSAALPVAAEDASTSDRVAVCMFHRYIEQQTALHWVEYFFATTRRPVIALLRYRRHANDRGGARRALPMVLHIHGEGFCLCETDETRHAVYSSAVEAIHAWCAAVIDDTNRAVSKKMRDAVLNVLNGPAGAERVDTRRVISMFTKSRDAS